MHSSRPSAAGRLLLGFAFTGFGLVCLGYADFVNSLEPVPAGMPGYRVLALINGTILLVTGLAILMNRGANFAARVAIVLLVSWIVLLHVPSAFFQPVLLRSPWWIRTFECLALASGTLILVARAQTPTRDTWSRAGRIGFGISLPVFGVLHLIYPESVAALIPPWYPWPLFLAYLTGVAMIAGGLAIATGVQARLAATLAAVMYGSWALTLHIPRVWCRVAGPCELLPTVGGLEGMRGELTSLCVAMGMAGAAFIVAGSLSQEPGSSQRSPRAGSRASSTALGSDDRATVFTRT